MLLAHDNTRYKHASKALEATEAHGEAGRWRQVVNMYKLAFRYSGDATSTFSSRTQCVTAFTSALGHERVQPNEDDWALLHELIDDSKCAFAEGTP
jgi:hypothetical protein